MVGSGVCEGSCTFPVGEPKDNSSGLLVSLSYLTCGYVLSVSNCVDEVCATPLNRRTTKCWSTQRGLACRQAHEPRKKNLVSILCLIKFLPVIGYLHCDWFISLRGGVDIPLTLLLTCKVVVTSYLV
jgi:hypothetical protein